MADEALLEGMRDLHLRIYRLFNTMLKREGASLAQLKLLLFIERGQAVRSIDISEAFGFAPRTVTEALDALEREGLVRREPDPNDRRAKRISITAAGRVVIRNADPAKKAMTGQIFEILSPSDAQTLQRLLDMLNARLVELGAVNPYGQIEQPGENHRNKR